jgi:hypothetical protein
MFYVTAVDKFSSNWGVASGRDNILCFECESIEDLEAVQGNCEARNDFKNVQIHESDPKGYKMACRSDELDYMGHGYYLQIKTKSSYPKFYIEGSFL